MYSWLLFHSHTVIPRFLINKQVCTVLCILPGEVFDLLFYIIYIDLIDGHDRITLIFQAYKFSACFAVHSAPVGADAHLQSSETVSKAADKIQFSYFLRRIQGTDNF